MEQYDTLKCVAKDLQKQKVPTMYAQKSVQQNFVRSQKVEQTDGQEHSRTRTPIFAKAVSNFLLRMICSTFWVNPFCHSFVVN